MMIDLYHCDRQVGSRAKCFWVWWMHSHCFYLNQIQTNPYESLHYITTKHYFFIGWQVPHSCHPQRQPGAQGPGPQVHHQVPDEEGKYFFQLLLLSSL